VQSEAPGLASSHSAHLPLGFLQYGRGRSHESTTDQLSGSQQGGVAGLDHRICFPGANDIRGVGHHAAHRARKKGSIWLDACW
jgi:hypothetical protein